MLEQKKLSKLVKCSIDFLFNFFKKLNKDNNYYLQYKILIISSQIMFFCLAFYFILDLICSFENPPNIITLSAIGILLSAFLTITNHFYNKEEEILKNKKDMDILLDNVVISIKEEISLLWNTYYENIGLELEKHIEENPDEKFHFFYPVEGEYFNIYKNNTELIMKIKEKIIREKIINIYIRAQGLIDTYNFNNKMLERYEVMVDNSTNKMQYELMLNEYAKTIYKLHNDLKEIIEDFFKVN